MKKISKSLFLLALPAVALTSCNTNKSLTFLEAQEYCAQHYDSNSFDNVDGKYTIRLNEFNINFDVTEYSGGASTNFPLSFGFDGISVFFNGPAITLNSAVIGYLSGLYTQFAAITAKFVTDIGIDLNYSLEDNGLRVAVESSNENTFTNLITVGLAGFHAAYVGFAIADGGFGSNILDKLGAMGLGLAPQSTGNGYIGFGLNTNDKGYITKVFYKANGEINYNLASNSFGKIDDKFNFESYLPQYMFHVKGSFNFDFEVVFTY